LLSHILKILAGFYLCCRRKYTKIVYANAAFLECFPAERIKMCIQWQMFVVFLSSPRFACPVGDMIFLTMDTPLMLKNDHPIFSRAVGIQNTEIQ
jgi:hypothetical protein